MKRPPTRYLNVSRGLSSASQPQRVYQVNPGLAQGMVVRRKPGSQLLPALAILVTAAAVGLGVVAATGIGPSYSELRARINSQNAVPACPPLAFSRRGLAARFE
jgi:hypothetical protein